MRTMIGVGVAGLFLAFAAPAVAQHEEGMIASFTERKIACETSEAMVAQAHELRSGKSDGLLLPRCMLLESNAVVLIDMKNSIQVPDCDDIFVYHVFVIHKKKVVRRDLFVAVTDLDEHDEN